MVELLRPPRAQRSNLLLLPAEVRIKMWLLLFADSKIVYNKCAYDKDLTTERYQITQTCRFAYLDAFNLLWSQTTIKYIGCVPAPNTAGLKEQFAASAPCRKLIPRLELEVVNSDPIQSQRVDIRGLRFFAPLKEVSIGPLQIPYKSFAAWFVSDENCPHLVNVGILELIPPSIFQLVSSSNITSNQVVGHQLRALLLRRNRKYNIFLRVIIFGNPLLVPGRKSKQTWFDGVIDWDNRDGKKIIKSSGSIFGRKS